MRFAILAILSALGVLLLLVFVPINEPDLDPTVVEAPQDNADAPGEASLIAGERSPVDWRATQAASGDWVWDAGDGQSKAEFAGGEFAMVCAPQFAQVSLRRSGSAKDGAIFDVWTTHERRRYRAGLDEGVATVTLAADDPILDAIALSRGHFGIAVEGAEPLLIPSWSEVTRVIEDCRR